VPRDSFGKLLTAKERNSYGHKSWNEPGESLTLTGDEAEAHRAAVALLRREIERKEAKSRRRKRRRTTLWALLAKDLQEITRLLEQALRGAPPRWITGPMFGKWDGYYNGGGATDEERSEALLELKRRQAAYRAERRARVARALEEGRQWVSTLRNGHK
jgi:hypothetical protein